MNIIKLGVVALGLTVAAMPAQAEIQSMRFTAEGVITEAFAYCWYGDPCDTVGVPAVGMPWQLTIRLNFTPSVSGTDNILMWETGFRIAGSLNMPATQYYAFKYNPLTFIDMRVRRDRLQELYISQAEDMFGNWVDMRNNLVSIYEWSYPWGDYVPELSYRGEGKITSLYINGQPSAMMAIPEPETWGLMIAGFGLVGFAARRREKIVA